MKLSSPYKVVIRLLVCSVFVASCTSAPVTLTATATLDQPKTPSPPLNLIELPDFTNTDSSQAIRGLEAVGIKYEVQESPEKVFGPGKVFAQKPKGGTLVDIQSTVILYVEALSTPTSIPTSTPTATSTRQPTLIPTPTRRPVTVTPRAAVVTRIPGVTKTATRFLTQVA